MQNYQTMSTVKDENKTKEQLIGELSELRKRVAQCEDFQSKEKYKQFFRTSRDCVFITSKVGRWIDLNDAAVELFGYSSREKLMHVNISDLYAKPEERVKHINIIAEKGFTKEFPVDLLRKDGTVIHTLITSVPRYDKENNVVGFQGTIRDITEQKLAEQFLKISEARYRRIVDTANEGILMLNEDSIITFANAQMAEMLGYTIEELINKSYCSCLFDEDLADHKAQMELRKTGQSGRHKCRIRKKDGSVLWTINSATVLLDEEGRFQNSLGMFTDITEWNKAEKALKEKLEDLHRLTTVVSDSNDAVILHNFDGKILAWNRGAEETYGYTEAEALQKNIRDIVAESDREAALTLIQRIKQGEVVKSFELQRLTKDGRILDVWLTITLLADEKGEPVAIATTERDITSRKLAEEELKQTTEKLRKSLIGTIQAMSLMVETRDPYTAGHQRKVSNLARTIAQEMGLSKDTIDNIRIAGIIHDIGKMSIPAEILSKPGKISDIEMNLIKVHSQSGYDILKDVELPYPVAEIVLQHHERLDGSGYPQGLKGDKILLEAKIICLADVVEAMESHRPYRPGLGIDAALEEIEKNKGILYDAGAVEACLKLFRKKGFTFEPTKS